MTEEQEIKSTLEDYAKAYCAKDIDSLMAVFEDSDDISAIGTGADELCEGRAAVKELFLRNFAEATAYEFEWQWSNINILNDYAVVAISLVIHLEYQGERLEIPIRWSVALRKTDRWVWLHRHASSPAVNQDEGQAYPQES
ncbi:nuclear transport factor 2 family protein [Thalassotalea nanhaiensis]|uniref:Nuclear transport factor 2 family protein n=1 Tax=Thalassotalea nanhaiensis TaxID=3065648 RepID=A0ABY9TJ71_9GAMM|nr:nuclear transport factor 2 family protein [Colwelliaceae bacterium SQ345]